jgi:hypothetical protein
MASGSLRLLAFGAWLAMLPEAVAACQVDVSQIPLAEEDARSGAADAAPADTGVGTQPEAEPDLRRHVACLEPVTDPLPEQPAIATTLDARPEFDLEGRFDCAQLAFVRTCDQPETGEPYSCTSCVGAPEAGPERAVCVPFARRGCVPMAHGPGCVACVAPEVKAKACCLALEVDCRVWPFEGSSGPGELCARHADCAAGLVCKAPADETRFGLCSCPEQEPPLLALDGCLWERP